MENKSYFDLIFVVLVYRNTNDLKDFFRNFTLDNAKVVVVNSYFDSRSDNEFKKIATAYNADFITVPNEGYGAGNNRGIEYAVNHYDFNFLIISNADITIRHFSNEILHKNKHCIIAPKILTKTGKNQNPSSPFKPNRLIELLLYHTYRGNHSKLVIAFYAFSRLQKILYYAIKRFKKHIYSPHGAFIIIPHKLLLQLIPIFNEDVFLFYEENHLGKLAESKAIKTIYSPEIIIDHKEDGSVSLLNANNFDLMKDAYIKMYEYWH